MSRVFIVCSCCLSVGGVELQNYSSHLTLCLNTTARPLQLDLPQLTHDQSKLQLQELVFDLWTRVDSACSELAGIYGGQPEWYLCVCVCL